MLDMIDDKTSVEQTNITKNTQHLDGDMMDKNGGVLATLTTLSASVVEWRELQGKADDKLYSVLDGCLRIVYLCEDEDLKATLLSVCKEKDMKGMDNKGVNLIVSKLVFGSGDKKCYTYAKALENASKLQLHTEKDKRTLSEYLKSNGGIDALIRKEAIAISKGYEDERFGTKEHFGENLSDELFGYLSGLNLMDIDKVKEDKVYSGVCDVKIDNDEFMKKFVNKEEREQFVKLKYDYTTKTFHILPFCVSVADNEYNAINKAYNLHLARMFDGTDMYQRYIALCDKRAEKKKADKAKKDKEMIEELNKFAPL